MGIYSPHPCESHGVTGMVGRDLGGEQVVGRFRDRDYEFKRIVLYF